MQKAIYFDMDGTIANLYAVPNWLPRLRSYDAGVYIDAQPMVHMATLARMLNKLQREGWTIGVVSWGSKDPDPDLHIAIEGAKKRWLAQHMPSVKWDEVHIVPYGVPKSSVVDMPQGFLFDDEKANRVEWRKGKAFDVDNILTILSHLA